MKGGKQMKLKNEELLKINGGAFTFSSALGNFIINAYNYIVDLGRYFGSAVHHMLSRTKC